MTPLLQAIGLVLTIVVSSGMLYAANLFATNKPQPQASVTRGFRQFVAVRGPNSGLSQSKLATLFKKFVQWQQTRQ